MTFVNEELMLRYINENKPEKLAEYVRTSPKMNETIDLLIRKMELAKDASRRQTIALALADLECGRAVKPIVDIINKYCGTTSDYSGMVYALLKMNCSRYIMELYHLTYDGNYMVRRYAHDLIMNNIEFIKADDLKIIKDDLKKQQGELKDKLSCVNKLMKDIDNSGQ